MTENDVNPPINNDPMEKKKRNEFIDHPSYIVSMFVYILDIGSECICTYIKTFFFFFFFFLISAI